MLQKLISAPTDEANRDTVRKELFTAISKGNFKRALELLHAHPNNKRELVSGRGGQTGRNIIYWIGQYIEKTKEKGEISKVTNAIANPSSHFSQLLKELSCAPDILGTKVSGDSAAPTGSIFLSSVLINNATSFKQCIEYLGAQFGTTTDNDAITSVMRQAQVWRWFNEKPPTAGNTNVLIFGPGIFTDPSASLSVDGAPATKLEFAQPFSPQIHELCSVLGTVESITVVDCSARVIELVSDTTNQAIIPDYMGACRLKAPRASQTAPAITPMQESIVWNKDYFAKFKPKTYDVIMATYVFLYPLREIDGDGLADKSCQVYRRLFNAIKPGGTLVIDSNSLLQSFGIQPSQLEAQWGYLMSQIKETLKVFPRIEIPGQPSQPAFTMEHIMDNDDFGTNTYFCFTRKHTPLPNSNQN